MEYKYRYLHICPPSTRMMKGFIMMLNNHFTPSEHWILCRTTSTGEDGFTALFTNIINWKDLGKGKIRKLLGAQRAMTEAKNIVVHGFTFSLKWLTLMYFNRKQLEQKGIWVIWGVDLYNYHRTSGSRLINKIINHMEDKIRESCRTSVVVFPTDVAVFRRLFNDKKVLFSAPIGFSETSFSQWDEILAKRTEVTTKYPNAYTRPDRKVSIQVGHNAFPFNRHAEALAMLEPHKSKNILITMPMSYGNDYGNKNTNYGDDLMHLAYGLFPSEKIRRLTALMPLRRYYEFLGAVDVSILCAPRQNALGNIIPLLYMGKKLYLSDENPLFEFFKSKGFEIHNIKELYGAKYEDIIAPITRSYPNPWIKNCYSADGNAKRWEVVFGFSDGRYTKEEASTMMAEYDRQEELEIAEYLRAEEVKQEQENIEKKEKENAETIAQELLQIYGWLEKRHTEDEQKREEAKNRKDSWERRRLELVVKMEEERLAKIEEERLVRLEEEKAEEERLAQLEEEKADEEKLTQLEEERAEEEKQAQFKVREQMLRLKPRAELLERETRIEVEDHSLGISRNIDVTVKDRYVLVLEKKGNISK